MATGTVSVRSANGVVSSGASPKSTATVATRRSRIPAWTWSFVLGPLPAFLVSQWHGSANLLPRLVLAAALTIWSYVIGKIIQTRRENLAMLCFALFNIMGIIFPGMLQSANNRFPFYGATYATEVLQNAALLVLAYTATVSFTYLYYLNKAGRAPMPALLRRTRTVLMPLAVPALSVLTVLVMFAVGTRFFTSPRLVAESELGGIVLVSPVTLIPIAVGRSLGFVTLAVVFARMREHKPSILSWSPYLVLALGIFYVTNNPFNEARFSFAAFLIALMAMVLDTRQPRAKALVVLGYAFGILVAMPVMDAMEGRTATGRVVDDLIHNYSGSLDYDGFQSIMNVMMWTGATGVKLGAQLFSGLLFFIPHTVWHDKALPTGVAAARYIGYPSQNISSPLPSEFYADFGAVGLVVLSAFLGRLLAAVDRALDSVESWSSSLVRLPFVTFAGFTAIIARGALLAIIGPTVAALAVSTLAVYALTKRTATRTSNRRSIPQKNAVQHAG